MNWQAIETAPKDRPLLLASTKSRGWRIWATEGWDNGHWAGQGIRNDPTHWMELPAPPHPR